MKQYIGLFAQILKQMKLHKVLHLYACTSQPCENTAGDVRQHAHNNNSFRGLEDAAQNLTLQHILESPETIQITASTQRVKKYAIVQTDELISEEHIKFEQEIAHGAIEAVMQKGGNAKE